MIPAPSIKEVEQRLRFGVENRNRMLVGLLFAPDHLQTTKEEIYPSIRHYDQRSGQAIHFFFAGYSQYRGEVEVPAIGEYWYYNTHEFQRFAEAIEQKTKWRYSGGADLLMLDAKKDETESEETYPSWHLDFSEVVVLQLERLLQDKAILKIPMLLEQICKYADESGAYSNVWDWSDQVGLSQTRSALWEFILSLIPEAIRNDARIAKHFVVQRLA